MGSALVISLLVWKVPSAPTERQQLLDCRSPQIRSQPALRTRHASPSSLPERHARDRRQSGQRHRELAFIVLLIGELAGEVVAVRLHVKVAVPAQVEEDGARDAFLAAANRFVDGAAHRVIGLRRRHDAFGSCAKITPASKHSRCLGALASMRPSSFTCETSGAMPW